MDEDDALIAALERKLGKRKKTAKPVKSAKSVKQRGAALPDNEAPDQEGELFEACDRAERHCLVTYAGF